MDIILKQVGRVWEIKLKFPQLIPYGQSKAMNFGEKNGKIILEWNNGEGIVFKKIISLDEKYLFKVKQEVKNNTKKDN